MKDSLGDRMKDYENRTRYYLSRRTYTLLRLDGKSFHTYTKGLQKPFDMTFLEDMQETTKYLCENIQGCKLGYTQSDEITLLLTDFDDIGTDAWFDGNLQKIVSVSAGIASAYFSRKRDSSPLAVFDARAWSIADVWEVYNTFLWRQQDATKNAINMVAQSVASFKECQNKNGSALQELIFEKGQNFNDYPVVCKRGTFVYRKDNGWFIDKDAPILTQDKDFFFDKVPLMRTSLY